MRFEGGGFTANGGGGQWIDPSDSVGGDMRGGLQIGRGRQEGRYPDRAALGETVGII